MSPDADDAVPVAVEDFDTRPSVSVRPILVVDDTPANLIAAEAALAPLGRGIVTASSGTEALARLLEQDFALVLLDVQMPGLDGYETARYIRARERTQHLPIIFTTANSHDEAAVLRAYEIGAVDFLFKPITAEILRARAAVFITLQERTEQLAAERMERDFENRRRDYETSALRRERDRELAANRELARLNEALAAFDRRKDSFIAILAHELRNPLAPVRTCIDLLRGDSAQQLTPKMLEILDRQTGTLARLVDDLLDLSRIKADKIELRPELTDLQDILESAIVTCKPFIDERDHAIVLEGPPTPIAVMADAVRLGQVVSNLLNNAARYTPPGGRIVVSCMADGDAAMVCVEDNGMGIDPELQPTIFDMFVQERVESDGFGGLGLGLALSRRLVELHQGEITVHSAGRNCGTRFEVRIPLAVGQHGLLPPRTRTAEMVPLARPLLTGSHIRTVVIDDNEDARELLSDLLRSRGYEVLTACDGPSGLELIRATKPDVALVDVGLPGLDGIGVVQRLGAECPGLATRLIALTGYGEAADVERTAGAGFHAHLVKPASAAAIFECLREQLKSA